MGDRNYSPAADFAIVEEVEGGEVLEWVQTTPIGDPDIGEPGIAVSVYRVPPEVSLAPPMSRLAPKSTGAKDIHTLRSIYRKAEMGEINPVIDELQDEQLVSIVIGDSVNYGTILAVTGFPLHIRGLCAVIDKLKEQGYQKVDEFPCVIYEICDNGQDDDGDGEEVSTKASDSI